MSIKHTIRVGIGGWHFERWRNNFYPAGWPQHRELEYASRIFNSIELYGLEIVRAAFTNGTPPFPYIQPFGAQLFLSTHPKLIHL